MIRHTDGNMHALDAHERSCGDADFAAMAKQVEAALVGQKYYELKDGVIVERTIESVTLDDNGTDDYDGMATVTLDESVVCYINSATFDILCFQNDDCYYVTREEAEEALREMSE